MNVTEPIRRLALVAPDRPALIGPADSIVTYDELDRIIDLVGLAAGRQGLKPGNAVGLGIEGPEGFRALMVALGLARQGIASADTAAPGLSLLLHAAVSPARTDTRCLPLAQFWDAMTLGRTEIPLGPIHTDPALFRIFASSGTTGRPKFMTADHRLMAGRVFDQWLSLGRVPPVHFVGTSMGIPWGMTQVLRTLWSGGTLLICDPRRLHAAALRHGATSMTCSPGGLALILDGLPEDTLPPPSLQLIEVSGSTLSPKLRARAEARLCPNLISFFGSAETGGIAAAPFRLLDGVPGAVGYLHPGVQAQAVDEAGRVRPPGKEGVLRFRSRAPVAGYLGAPATTARIFRDGWFYSGDIGVVTADGLLVLTGRASEVINADGLKVAPSVIERVLCDRPEVTEAAAFGATDAAGMRRICAAVVADTDIDATALLAYARSHLGDGAPSFILQVKGLPRNANGKILREALALLAAEKLASRR